MVSRSSLLLSHLIYPLWQRGRAHSIDTSSPVPLSSSSSSQPRTLCEHILNHIRDLGAPDPPPKYQLAVNCELRNMHNPTTKADPIITDLSMLGFGPVVACHGHVMSGADCDGEINAMVEGSKFRESQVLRILIWREKEGGMPRPLVVHCPDLCLVPCFSPGS